MFGDYLKAIDILDLMAKHYDDKFRQFNYSHFATKSAVLREAIKKLRVAWQDEQLRHEATCEYQGLKEKEN